MEWQEVFSLVDGSSLWWELRVDGDVAATAWRSGSFAWWSLGSVGSWEMAQTMADAKSAAWAAVYRSTR